MPINTAKVTGRRKLAFESLDEVLMDAEALAADPNVRMLGNWSQGQVYAHLAAALHMSIDGIEHQPPWFIRLIGPWFKYRVLRGMSAGFQLPKRVADVIVPATPLTTEEGLKLLQDAVKRFRADTTRKPHNVFGRLSGAEWHTLHLRHSELHLSFAIPSPNGKGSG